MATASEVPSSWMLLTGDPETSDLLEGPLRLASGITVLPHRDGLALVGGPTTEFFSGLGTRSIMADVLPLLDGTLSVADIESRLPQSSAEHIRAVVANLFLSGLIRRGTAAPEDTSTTRYFDRLIGYTGAFESGQAAGGHLKAQRLAVHGPPDLARSLCDIFDRTTGAVLSRVVQSENGLDSETDLLLSVSTSTADDPLPLFARAADLGVPSLNVEIRGDEARVGPLFLPRRTAGYVCYRQAHERLIEHALTPGDPLATRVWATFALHLAMSILVRLTKQAPMNAFTDYTRSGDRRVVRRTTIARLTDWTTDAPLTVRPGQPGYEGWKQYCGVALQSPRYSPENAYLAHFKPENIRAMFERTPAIFSEKTIPLRPFVSADGRITTPRSPVETLGALLQSVAGYGPRDGAMRRIAPTGGNLGSTLAAVLVRNIEGVEAGAYWYDASDHKLEVMQGVDVGELTERYSLIGETATLVTFANASKVARKYGPFSFNIGWYDAGVLLSHARAFAAASDLVLEDQARPLAERFLTDFGFPDSALVLTGVIGLSPARDQRARTFDPSAGAVLTDMTDRRAIREWSRRELRRDEVHAWLQQARPRGAQSERYAGRLFDLSLLLLLKMSDAEDGFYAYDDGGALTLVAACPRDLHQRFLSQESLTKSPVLVFPTVDLEQPLIRSGDAAVEDAYRICGAEVGRFWLDSGRYGWGGTACGGVFEGEVRHLTGRHSLRHFAPLALCIGPVA